MAIYHLRVTAGTRARGQSARAHVDYVLRQGKYAALKNRPSADQVRHAESTNMPAWVHAGHEREYWAAADANERANGVLYRSLEFALPVELDVEQQRELARGFIASIAMNEEGTLPCTWAIHSGHDTNPHVHAVVSERVNDGIARSPDLWFRRAKKDAPEKGGALKADIGSRRREWLEATRALWTEHANQALAQAGKAERIDHRSYAELGSEKVPGVHLGPSRHRALREHRQGKPSHEIARTDQTLMRAAQARRARSIQFEIAALKVELSTMHPLPKPAEESTNGGEHMTEQTNRPGPDSATAIRRREQADHGKWARLDQRRRDQALAEQDELAAKRRRDQQAADYRRAARERQAEQEQREIEQQLGIHQSADQAILAGGTQTEIEHAGSRYMRPAALVLAGYTARKITTKRGYGTVAYYLSLIHI